MIILEGLAIWFVGALLIAFVSNVFGRNIDDNPEDLVIIIIWPLSIPLLVALSVVFVPIWLSSKAGQAIHTYVVRASGDGGE